MNNVIQFPLKNSHEIDEELAIIKSHLIKCGLSDADVDTAISEIEPLIKPLFEFPKSIMDIPGEIGLTDEQLIVIIESHNKSMQDIFKKFAEKTSVAALTIAGLVGKQLLRNARDSVS